MIGESVEESAEESDKESNEKSDKESTEKSDKESNEKSTREASVREKGSSLSSSNISSSSIEVNARNTQSSDIIFAKNDKNIIHSSGLKTAVFSIVQLIILTIFLEAEIYQT